MKLRISAALAVAACALVWTSASHATSYNLATDFSNTANPNGPWSYSYGAAQTLLPHQPTVAANGNPHNPSIPAAGYFATGNDTFNNTPWVQGTAVNGSAAGQTNADYLAGDILVHSANNGDVLFITWTAPTAGTVQFGATFSWWYAHSAVDRANNIGVYYNGIGSIVDATSQANHPGRDNAGSSVLLDPLGFHLNVGETLVMTIEKSAGQSSGSLTGINMAFEFIEDATSNEVPVPGALPLFASGIAGVGALMWRRRRKAA